MKDIFDMSLFPLLIQMEKSKLESFGDFYLELLYDLHSKSDELKEKLEKKAESLKKKQLTMIEEEYFNSLGEDYFKYSEEYPNHINKTILVFCYSFLENSIKSILEMVIKISNSDFEINNIRDDFFGKYKKGIEKVSRINLRKYDKDYQQLKTYQFVRNKIIHNNSQVFKNKEINRIKGIKQITFNSDSGEYFLKDKTYIESFIEVVVNFLKSILNELEQNQTKFISNSETSYWKKIHIWFTKLIKK